NIPTLEHIERSTTELRSRHDAFEEAAPLPFEREVELRGVSYSYPRAEAPALRDVSFVVPRGTATAIVGHTGSGKTTALDVFLGLLRPTEGAVLVDGEPLTPEKVRAWQAAIGYVPQHVFLSDDTIARNIAFGVAEEKIDAAAVE